MKKRNRILTGIATTGATMLGMSMPAVTASASNQGMVGSTVPHVVVTGLNQPHKVTMGLNGNLLVAEAGLNTPPSGCHNGTQAACVDASGAVARINRFTQQVTTAVSGLPSVASGNGPGSTGPVDVFRDGGRLQILMQAVAINPTTGAPLPASANSRYLDKLVSTWPDGSHLVQEADLGAYEAAHNPDHGVGAAPGSGNVPIESDPYAIVPYLGGIAIADAAGNDVLYYRNGQLSTLAVLPLITEHVPAGGLHPGSKPAVVKAQAVPTSLAVGPDGSLYIGELGGGPYDVGDTNIYKIHPGGSLLTVATGLTMVGDIAFDHSGASSPSRSTSRDSMTLQLPTASPARAPSSD